jgi:hypothetical protein
MPSIRLRPVLPLIALHWTTAAVWGQVTPPKPIAARAVATLIVPGFADFLAADDQSVWATNEDRIEQLRADRSGPVASVAIPRPCGAPVVAYGSVWVASCADRSIYRVGRDSHRVEASIPTGLADSTGELSLAAGAGGVWVLSDPAGVLSRIDASTNRVVARIPVASHSYAAAFGGGAVWITNTGDATGPAPGAVQRIDPGTNRVVATVRVGPTPRFLAVGEAAVWTLNQGDGSVSRIGIGSNRLEATIPVGVSGPGGDIATGAGRVWVRATKVLLSVIDPRRNQVAERFGPVAGSGAVRVAGALVWVSAHDIHTIWALRP